MYIQINYVCRDCLKDWNKFQVKKDNRCPDCNGKCDVQKEYNDIPLTNPFIEYN